MIRPDSLSRRSKRCQRTPSRSCPRTRRQRRGHRPEYPRGFARPRTPPPRRRARKRLCPHRHAPGPSIRRRSSHAAGRAWSRRTRERSRPGGPLRSAHALDRASSSSSPISADRCPALGRRSRRTRSCVRPRIEPPRRGRASPRSRARSSPDRRGCRRWRAPPRS